jgi:diguanylate cyclase (GGDEF)-like protein
MQMAQSSSMNARSSSFFWQRPASALIPAIAAAVLAGTGVLGFFFWSVHNIDQLALERQTGAAARAIERVREQLRHDQAGITLWDDAVANTAIEFDPDWVHTHLGRFTHVYLGHDRTLLLSADGTPLYAMLDGEPAAPATASAVVAQIESVLALARSQPPPTQDGTHAIDLLLVDGRPAVVAASPILSHTGMLPQAAGTEPLLASIRFLDQALAGARAAQHTLRNAGFVTSASAGSDRAVYPIRNRAGRFVAFLEWHADKPGQLLIAQAGPGLAGGIGITGLVLCLLVLRLRRSTAALHRGRLQAEHQALHDSLTGLPNRTHLDRHLEALLAGAPASERLWVLMLDLDRFKQVNDTLGHRAGDRLLCAVGDRIRATAGDSFLSRIGGDEFALVGLGSGPAGGVKNLAARLVHTINEPFPLGSFKAHVGVSIGMLETSLRDADPLEIVRRADIALYEAKARGRNRAVTYEDHMSELLQLHNTIEGELREALNTTGQIAVAFQPLVDQRSRSVIGAEALARWHHPTFGQISPARFIPIAESTGLIETLGEIVLRRACELGASQPGRTIAVNISPTQLRNPAFAGQVFDILNDTGMRAMDLELEITESILLDDEHVSSQNLHTFRSAGIHIALDDFGTGYSSLSYLSRYPVDRIKIDRSFVSQLNEGHVSVAITDAIVTLAHAMNIEVTAEGVETADQADILGRLGCNTLQGFLFSGPVSPERMASIFAEPRNAASLRRGRAA